MIILTESCDQGYAVVIIHTKKETNKKGNTEISLLTIEEIWRKSYKTKQEAENKKKEICLLFREMGGK